MAETPLPLRIGDHLLLEVLGNEGTLPHLKILQRDVSASQPTLRTLRSALPRQEPIAQALRSLAAMAGNPEIKASLPTPLTDQLTALIESLPHLADLGQADQLETAIRKNGLLYESLQSQSLLPIYPSAPQDLKSRLLQLAHTLRTWKKDTRATTESAVSRTITPLPHTTRQTRSSNHAASISATLAAGRNTEQEATMTTTRSSPSQDHSTPLEEKGRESSLPPDSERNQEAIRSVIARKISAGLSRIILDQLASLPKPDISTLTWHFELPFRNGQRLDSLYLHIQEERRKSAIEETPPHWSVLVEMTPPGLGKIQVKLILQNGEINAYLWSDSGQTRALFERHLELLSGHFRTQGLETNHIQILQAPPESFGPVVSIGQPIVDELI